MDRSLRMVEMGAVFFNDLYLIVFVLEFQEKYFVGVLTMHIYMHIYVPSRLLDIFIMHGPYPDPVPTATAVYWPSTTKYLPVQPQNRPSTRVIQYCPTDPLPPSTKHHNWPIITNFHPVTPNTNQYCPTLTQFHQVSANIVLYWPYTGFLVNCVWLINIMSRAQYT